MLRKPPREPRYKGLAFSSLVCVGTGWYAITLQNTTPGSRVASGIIPLWLLGAIWLGIGLAGWGAVLLRRPGRFVFAAQFGLFTLWASSYWVAFLFFDYPTGYVVASWFTGIAGMVAYATRVEPPLWKPFRWWTALSRRMPWAR